MRKRRERITKGFAAVDDRTVWTLELNRDELMIIPVSYTHLTLPTIA